jgi:L-rhamnose-H+ transport protein
MTEVGIALVLLSGICNGLFAVPIKLIRHWKWENLWLVFVLTSCVVVPIIVGWVTLAQYPELLQRAPRGAIGAALSFGFLWGFGAILFGLSLDRLGVALSNSLVLGLSGALGSIVPLLLGRGLSLESRDFVLLAGVCGFLGGVWLCGAAGRLRDGVRTLQPDSSHPWSGFLFAVGAGAMSAVFNIGFSLALPISESGERLGASGFEATNCIWLLMLTAGSIPNLAFCFYLLRKNRSAGLFFSKQPMRGCGLAVLAGLLWAGSIFLYGAAARMLGDRGPAIGWPASLSVALLVANLAGLVLGEWRDAPRQAVRYMRLGILTLLAAILMCAFSTRA